MNYIIHVNQHIIRYNKKHGTSLPPYRIQHGRSDKNPRYAQKVIWNGPSETIYDSKNPLSCGAQIWIETSIKPDLIDECVYSDIKVAMKE